METFNRIFSEACESEFRLWMYRLMVGMLVDKIFWENYLSGNSFRFRIYVGKYKEGEGGGGKGKI